MKKAVKNQIHKICKQNDLGEVWEKVLIELVKSQSEDKRSRLIASVVSVSSSGMSRNLRFGFFRKSGYFQNLTPVFSKIYGAKYNCNKNCFRVNGCGMDMIYHTIETVFYYLIPADCRKDYSEFSRMLKYERF